MEIGKWREIYLQNIKLPRFHTSKNMCYVLRYNFSSLVSTKFYIQAKNGGGGGYIYKIVSSYWDSMLHLDFVDQ